MRQQPLFEEEQTPSDAGPRLPDAVSSLARLAVLKGARNGEVLSPEKLRGGYYTPPEIAAFLARWAIPHPDSRVLEPSCGDGELLAAASQRLGGKGHATGVELLEDEARKAALRARHRSSVVVGDAFRWFRSGSYDGAFDACIGNPPFIRYQSFPPEYRAEALLLMSEAGLKPSRLTNSWMPFVVLATRALRSGGRLAFVLPAELLQVSYAAQLREYLVRRYCRLTIIAFRKLIFPKIQQETVLLLAERGDSSQPSISFMEIDSAGDLSLERVLNRRPVKTSLDHGREKWTQYLLSAREVALLSEIDEAETFLRLVDVADVDVGIVTGRNEFFVLRPAQAEALGLRNLCRPLIGRTHQIPGLVVRRADWRRLERGDDRCLLLDIEATRRSELSRGARAYVEWGELHEVHRGYKCRIRLPNWWEVPSTWIPDAFLLRQIHGGPRIVKNTSGATSTDTIHRVRAKPGVNVSALTASFVNSLTLASAEVKGRSYGGGVLELEPTEAEALMIPPPSDQLDLTTLDKDFRAGGLKAVLDEVDRATLKPAGLNQREINELREIWKKLSTRRAARKQR